MKKKDFYEILGVGPDANAQQMKEAYRKKAFLFHPDRNPGDPLAMSRMKDLNEAYAVLADPTKRREYDALRNLYGASAYGRFRQGRSDSDIFSGSDVTEVFDEICKNFGFRGAQEVFQEFCGPGVRRSFGTRTNSGNSEVFLKFALWNLFRSVRPQRGRDTFGVLFISPWLALRGGKIPYKHKGKDGLLLVTIPPGVKRGQRLRLKGMGSPGRNGGAPGDLFITLRVGLHPLEMLRGWFFLILKYLKSARDFLFKLFKR